MAVLVDTSVWVDVLRDRSLKRKFTLQEYLAGGSPLLSRFTQLELLQGAKVDQEWNALSLVLDTQDYVEASSTTWVEAARIYYDLRRKGRTVESPIDCCIAQLAIENNLLLLHRDRDFKTIAQVRPLKHDWMHW